MVLAGVVMAGCAADTTDGGTPESTEEDLTSSSITLAGSGDAIEVTDSPKLKTGATGGLACGPRFEVDGRVRLTCTRGDELLEVIVRDGKSLLVHKPAKRADRKNYFACTVSGNGPDNLPKKLSCRQTPLRDRSGHGGLVSPFDSTIPGITIPNTHAVGTSGKLFRGMAPGSPAQIDELFAADIGAVLVFKNQTGTGTDVQDEIDTLTQRGIAQSRAVNIPFKWKELTSFKDACEQTVKGLKFIKTNLAANKKTFFHCTVGEDRTGFLAALHRVLTEQNLDADKAWDAEMCERGYGAGNPLKPGFVVGTLESSLKPLYQKMAYLADKGSLDALNDNVCATDPETAADFAAKAIKLDRLKCGTSTTFVP
jgi:hypothetical protein